MDNVIDLAMTRLFQLAEYVCSRCSSIADEPAAAQQPQLRHALKESTPVILFSKKDYVEGDLFK